MRSSNTTRFLIPAFVALAAMVASAQTFTDDFESYANGSNLDGQGGWRGWDGVSLGLTTVSNAFAFDGTQSVALAAGGDTIQEFDIHSGQWTITSQVYGPSGNTGTHWLVYLDEYADGGPYEWGGQLEFDSSNGTVECDCGGANAFVVSLVTDQ